MLIKSAVVYLVELEVGMVIESDAVYLVECEMGIVTECDVVYLVELVGVWWLKLMFSICWNWKGNGVQMWCSLSGGIVCGNDDWNLLVELECGMVYKSDALYLLTLYIRILHYVFLYRDFLISVMYSSWLNQCNIRNWWKSYHIKQLRSWIFRIGHFQTSLLEQICTAWLASPNISAVLPIHHVFHFCQSLQFFLEFAGNLYKPLSPVQDCQILGERSHESASKFCKWWNKVIHIWLNNAMY